MNEPRPPRRRIYRDHPVFFWGTLLLAGVFVAGAVSVAMRVPRYRMETEHFNAQLTATQRATRDSLLQHQQRRTELAVAVLRRDLRVRSLEQRKQHLAIVLEDSVMELRFGRSTVRRIPVYVGRDSTVRADDGRIWRLIQPVGERRIAQLQRSPTYIIPEWVYVSRGDPVPPEDERRVPGGLGEYVIRLDDGTEIYSRPSRGPLTEAVKPGGFMVRPGDMAAIFPALSEDTPVYIY